MSDEKFAAVMIVFLTLIMLGMFGFGWIARGNEIAKQTETRGIYCQRVAAKFDSDPKIFELCLKDK